MRNVRRFIYVFRINIGANDSRTVGIMNNLCKVWQAVKVVNNTTWNVVYPPEANIHTNRQFDYATYAFQGI